MKILIIGTTDKLGGAAKVSWEIKTALENEGNQVSMFVADKISDDPNVKIIPRIKWRKILGFLLSSEDFIKTDWILNTKEFKEADIIHCHNLHGRFFNLLTLQKMSKIKPVVWTLHDEWAITPHCACTFETNKMKNGLFICPSINTPPRLLWDNTRFLSWRKNSLYQKINLHIVVPSKWLKERVQKTLLVKQNIHLIHNGIDTNIFKPFYKKEARKKLNLPENKKIILFLADNSKNSPWKGWEYANKILKKYEDRNDILFLNIGNPEDIESYKNIKFIKHINDPNIVSLYYNSSDIFLFTSIAENFPLVILEAMACGLPIVSFDVGGVKEVLEHKKNGYIANYKNSESLKKGLDYVLSLNYKELEILKKNSSEKIKTNFDTKQMTDIYIELYKDIINNYDNN